MSNRQSARRASHERNGEGDALKAPMGRDAGSRVNRTWAGLVLQPRLTIGASSDPLECEADRVADHVLAAPGHPFISAAPPRIQRLPAQPAALDRAAAPASVNRVLDSPGAPLAPALRRDIEPRFGYDLSRVRVHAGVAAEQSARDVDAQAYTVGHNIVFGAGRFAPSTREGRHLIAHELTHVVQQSRAGGMRAVQRRANNPAGGCATCRSASAAGSVAHPFVQQLFVNEYGREIVSEAPVYNPMDDNGRLDLFRVDKFSRPKLIEYGEIKPDNDAGVTLGRRDLAWYGTQLSAIFRPPVWLVSRLDVEAPTGVVPFKDNTSAKCPNQSLSVRGTKPIGHEPGLYLYSCDPAGRSSSTLPRCCTERDEDKDPRDPPTIGDRLDDSKGDGKTKGDSKGKGEGEGEGKGNGEKSNGEKGNGEKDNGERDNDRWRPPAEGPRWGPEIGARVAAIIIALGAIVAFVSKFWKPLKLAAVLGLLLGTLLKWLGFGIGVEGEASAATPPGNGNGPAVESPAGKPIPGGVKPATPAVPPAGTTAPPHTTAPPVRTTPPPTGTTPAHGTTAPHGGKKPSPDGAGPPKAPATPPIKVALIEGLDLEKFAVGRFSTVLLDPGGPGETLVMLQAAKKVTHGHATTVEFVSHVCVRAHGGTCAAGQIYTVTHPYQPTGEPKLFGRAAWELDRFNPLAWDLDGLANELERRGRTVEAKKLRKEARDLKEMAEKGR